MFFTLPPQGDAVQELTSTEVRQNWSETVTRAEAGTETLIVRQDKVRAAVISRASYGALKIHRRNTEQAYESALLRIARIRREPEEGLDPVATQVAERMEVILRQLRDCLDIAPDRTVQTVDGGIDSYFFSAEKDEEGSPLRIVSLGVDGDGDVSLLFRSGDGMAAEDLTPETNLPQLSARITDFLSGEQPEPTSHSGGHTAG